MRKTTYLVPFQLFVTKFRTTCFQRVGRYQSFRSLFPLAGTALALTLLIVVGPGVCAASARAESVAAKKKTTATSAGKTRRAKSSRRSGRRERGQKAPTSDRITEIQQALARDGSFTGAPNGKWDGATVEAMKKFQEAHGLNPSGKLDAKTLQKLGLGSQTAGAAPPLPPISSSALTAPAAQTARRQQ